MWTNNYIQRKYKQLKEIKKTMQDMKEEINKCMEILKKKTWNKQINIPNKNLNQSLVSRVEQLKNWVSETEGDCPPQEGYSTTRRQL
jgi:hypothetical protein